MRIIKMFGLALLAVTAVGLGPVLVDGSTPWGQAFASDDERGEHEDEGAWRLPRKDREVRPGVAAVDNKTYQQACGGCHMAYPPGLLPPVSWERMMQGLDDHFGENAELLPDEHKEVVNYLLSNAAGRTNYRLSHWVVQVLGPNKAPLRITETEFFHEEHDEIPASMVKDNDQVRSFANCNACHPDAEKGRFEEDRVRIPGVGRFED